MNDCPNCDSEDTMYEQRDAFRCFKCGYKHTTEPIDNNRPFRREESKCGEIVSSHFEENLRGAVRKLNTKKNDTCSVNPSGIKEVSENLYMVGCTYHKE